MSMHKIELTEWEREGLELHRLPIGKPSQLSDTFRAGVQFATRKSNETIIDLSKRNCALQAKIDALMLEFCLKRCPKNKLNVGQKIKPLVHILIRITYAFKIRNTLPDIR